MIVSGEEAAEMAGEAIALGEAFCALPLSGGRWDVWHGDAPGVRFKVERDAAGSEKPALVHTAHR